MKGNKDMRIGMGYDVHKLVKDRKLILGGVNIPYEKGLLGHSDADVLIHAIMDALLGAAALGDIGKHFPDNDDSYKGISSMFLLEKVAGILEDNMYVVGNIDATIIAQQPKMRPHIEKMEENIAGALGIDVNQVNIKAADFHRPGQCKGDHRGRSWLYRVRRRNFCTGNMHDTVGV